MTALTPTAKVAAGLDKVGVVAGLLNSRARTKEDPFLLNLAGMLEDARTLLAEVGE